MKIICTTEKFIKESTSCVKEYCCKNMKKTMTPHHRKNVSSSHEYIESRMSQQGNKIILETHDDYDYHTHEMKIAYCPWCGTKVKVEHVKVDKTNEAPVPMAASPKKRWWQR